MTLRARSVCEGGIRWVSFRNDAEDDMPAFAAMRITGVETTEDGACILLGDVPNKDGMTSNIAINSASPVVQGGYGSCTLDFPAMAAFEDGEHEPAAGDPYGTKANQFELVFGFPGFTLLGRVEDETRGVITRRSSLALAQAKAAIDKDASGTWKLYFGAPGSEEFTEAEIDAYNKLGHVSEGDWGQLWTDGRNWYNGASEC